MNKDVVGNAKTENIEIMDPVDDSKPAAMNIDSSALEIQDISAPAPLEQVLDSPVAKKEAVVLTIFIQIIYFFYNIFFILKVTLFYSY